MKISVALASYNGACYILDQLESIGNQSRMPDELIVSDDCSTDSTINIVEEFAKEASFKVLIYKNEENIGYASNFLRAISKCSGDIIFLSDQDDVWFADKIKKILDRFQERPEAQVILNDMVLCDERLQPSPFTQLGNILSAGGQIDSFYSGCCMAIKSSFSKLLFPQPERLFAHDSWINHLALALDTRELLPEVLQMYRRHEQNTSNWDMSSISGTSKVKLIKNTGLASAHLGWVDQVHRYRITKERIITNSSTLYGIGLLDRQDLAMKYLDNKIKNLQSRIDICENIRFQRILPIVKLWASGGYADFSGVASAVKDLIRP